jgi:hypothetical protein
MAVRIKMSRQPLDQNSLQQFESTLPAPFTDDYRKFLLNFNGGRPEANVFDIPGFGQAGVSEFFGILTEKEDGDLRAESLRMKARIPSEMLAVADAEGGNLLLLALTGPDRGAVYLWDHEFEAEEGETPRRDTIHIVAKSFQTFFAALEKFDPSKVQLGKHQVVKKIRVNPDFLKRMQDTE